MTAKGRPVPPDVDGHIQGPVDIWTSRVSKKWGKRVPHVRAHPETGKPVWFINEEPSISVAGLSMAGWKEWPPSHPPTLEEADHAAWDSTVRLERMDDYGIHTEILYPNVGGFGNQNFMKLEDPALMLECIRAYNDFQVDWCSVDPKRLIPTTAIPFWDVDATVAEIERCTKMGHRGIIMTGGPENFGSPYLGDPHWEPVWTVCEELGVAPEDTVAMGDSESDIEMLRFAGLGIAVRNSPDEVKRDALHVAPSNDEDGVAWVIQKFVI
ncbi:MAG: HAD hydrolase family protein [Chloroflexi bacterium]|nr:HAD hydrolase family protein [Chloroflexota bacterium]